MDNIFIHFSGNRFINMVLAVNLLLTLKDSVYFHLRLLFHFNMLEGEFLPFTQSGMTLR
jgi:hypothetical protein